MISTVTVSTVTTVTAVTASTVTGIITVLGFIAIAALIVLLSTQEIARASKNPSKRNLARFLSVGTVPLLLAVGFIVAIRVAGALA